MDETEKSLDELTKKIDGVLGGLLPLPDFLLAQFHPRAYSLKRKHARETGGWFREEDNEKFLAHVEKQDEEWRLARPCRRCGRPRLGRLWRPGPTYSPDLHFSDEPHDRELGWRLYVVCRHCAAQRQSLVRDLADAGRYGNGMTREERAMYRQLLRLAARDDVPGAP